MKTLLTLFHYFFATLAFTALFILAASIYTTGDSDLRYAAGLVVSVIFSGIFYYMAKERV